ncbi:MAG: RsmB/NOP family class I SAM-dependent RNA methyltransferase [Collinsella sp.]|nr:RsmB/NOP family class I SAM-dependent RNA methyltransferase [Collinsella sp.]
MSDIPAFLRERVSASFGAESAELVFEGWREAAARPVTLRANTLRSDADEVAAALEAAGLAHRRVPWYRDAFVMGPGVVERDLWNLPIYQEGKVYLQSLSSMLPPLALAPAAGTDILDMCAAPGGKTSQMAALAPGAHICACELNAPRAERLGHNLAKLGVENVQVMRTDARTLDEFFSFDQVLVDAPCTGSGTFRAGDARAAGRITEKLLTRVVKAQRALLDRALTVLKPGGTLLYSTCSILPEENEEQVRAVLGMRRHRDCEIVPLKVPLGEAGEMAPRLLQTGLDGTLCLAPSELFEGFFLAKISRPR